MDPTDPPTEPNDKDTQRASDDDQCKCLTAIRPLCGGFRRCQRRRHVHLQRERAADARRADYWRVLDRSADRFGALCSARPAGVNARWLRTGPRGHRQDGKRTHGAATTASERLTQLTPINITIYPYPGVECEGVVEPAGAPKTARGYAESLRGPTTTYSGRFDARRTA
jgi:hypothetical protein